VCKAELENVEKGERRVDCVAGGFICSGAVRDGGSGEVVVDRVEWSKL
jgi:hypothetical protein